jgi:hypothetical protein
MRALVEAANDMNQSFAALGDDSELRSLLLEVRHQLLRWLEKQLRSKHPSVELVRTSAGSNRLILAVVAKGDTSKAAEATDEFVELGTRLMGEGWLGGWGLILAGGGMGDDR